MSGFVQQSATAVSFTGSDSWVILSPIELSIKRKIEAVGVPLKDWDINIYRGILTGYNEAFVISGKKRAEILAACSNDDERRRSDDIIRPILRGRDIKRYSYDWAGLYLVWIPWHFPLHLDNSIVGASQKAEDAFKKEYPAIYNYLLQYKDKLAARNKAETGIRYEWYALQRWGANYWDDFFSPKIIFQEIVQESQFALDMSGTMICNDTCRIITGENLQSLIHILNSKLFFYAVKTFYGGGGLGDGVRMKHTFFQNFCCLRDNFDGLPLHEIEKLIYSKYNLTRQEINLIERI